VKSLRSAIRGTSEGHEWPRPRRYNSQPREFLSSSKVWRRESRPVHLAATVVGKRLCPVRRARRSRRGIRCAGVRAQVRAAVCPCLTPPPPGGGLRIRRTGQKSRRSAAPEWTDASAPGRGRGMGPVPHQRVLRLISRMPAGRPTMEVHYFPPRRRERLTSPCLLHLRCDRLVSKDSARIASKPKAAARTTHTA